MKNMGLVQLGLVSIDPKSSAPALVLRMNLA